MQSVDLNCDMGEGYGHWSYGDAPDEALMPLISSANVAAGFHGGDPNLMDRVAALAVRQGVGLGVHPGYHDLQGFGRRPIAATNDELVNDILYQVGALELFARRHGTSLSHIKLHGALYMTAAADPDLSRGLIEALQKATPGLPIYCMGVSQTYRIATAAGYPTVREFYADRDYDRSGSIVFARKVERFDPEALAEKCVRACLEGRVRTVEGADIEIGFESICFHSDTPGALEIGQAVRAGLEKNGIVIARPGT